MSDEWGPWIEHDGRGCPVRGMRIMAGWFHVGPLGETWIETKSMHGGYVWDVPINAGADPDHSVWWWSINGGIPECADEKLAPLVRYRIRKPRALMDLIEMVENLPSEKERERETA